MELLPPPPGYSGEALAVRSAKGWLARAAYIAVMAMV